MFCVTSSEFDPLSASLAKMPAFDKSINSKKKKSASLWKTKHKGTISRLLTAECTQQYSLQVADFAFQKVHDARREYEAGEYGKKSSNTWSEEKTRNYVKFIHFFVLISSMKPDWVSFGKWVSCVNSRSRLRLLTHYRIHFLLFIAQPWEGEANRRKKKISNFTFATRISISAKCCFFKSFAHRLTTDKTSLLCIKPRPLDLCDVINTVFRWCLIFDR